MRTGGPHETRHAQAATAESRAPAIVWVYGGPGGQSRRTYKKKRNRIEAAERYVEFLDRYLRGAEGAD